MHRLVRPPPEQHEERQPEEHELDRGVNRAALRDLGRRRGRAPKEPERVAREEDRRDGAVCGEGDEREEDHTEPAAGERVSEGGGRSGEGETDDWRMPLFSRTCSILSTS